MWTLFDTFVCYTIACVVITTGWIIGKLIKFAYDKIESKRG